MVAANWVHDRPGDRGVLGRGEVDLDDSSLNNGVVEHQSCSVGILTSGHGDESKPLGAFIIVDDLRIFDVSIFPEQHDQVVFSESEGDVGHVESLGSLKRRSIPW